MAFNFAVEDVRRLSVASIVSIASLALSIATQSRVLSSSGRESSLCIISSSKDQLALAAVEDSGRRSGNLKVGIMFASGCASAYILQSLRSFMPGTIHQ